MPKPYISQKGGANAVILIFFTLLIIGILLLIKNWNVVHLFEKDVGPTLTPAPTSTFRWK